jgi:hypothetical protein
MRAAAEILDAVGPLENIERLYVVSKVQIGLLNMIKDPDERAYYVRLIKQEIAPRKPPGRGRKVKHLRVIKGGRP